MTVEVQAMSQPVLHTGKMSGNRYKFSFTTDDGKIIAEVSVARSKGPPDARSDAQKKEEALAKLKRLAQALDASLTDK
jgi:hypothetical protein